MDDPSDITPPQPRVGPPGDAERRFARIVELANEGIWEIDGRFLTTFVNRKMADMLGYDPVNMIGQPVSAFMFEEDLDEHRVQMRQRAEGHGAIYERRFRRADGSVCWCRVSATALRDADGRFTGSFAMFTDITEQKRNEQTLRRTTELLDSIRDAQSRYIANEEAESIFQALLGTLTRATGSPIGFLDEVRHESGGGVYKVSLALTDIAWDAASRRLYAELVSQDREFRNLGNLAGFPALHGQPVIANDASHDPRAGGLPPGHPTIHAFMGLPLYFGGELVGVAGVANRPGGYSNQMAASLAPLLSTCAGIIHAMRADRRERAQQEALRRHADQARFLAEASITLTTFTTADEIFAFIRASVPTILPGVITITGRATDDGGHLEVVDIQGADDSLIARAIAALGLDPRGRRFAVLDRFREIYARTRLHRHEEGLADFAASVLPRAVSAVVERVLGLRAIYTIGIADGGRVYGHLHVFVTGAGATVETVLVESFVHLCSLAFARVASHVALQESEENFRQFAEAVHEVFWLRDADLGRIVYVNPAYEAIFGRTCQSLYDDSESFGAGIHPDDRPAVQEARRALLSEGRPFDCEYRIRRTDGAERWIHARAYPAAGRAGRSRRFAGTAADVTDRKRAEEDRLAIERRLLGRQKFESLGVLAGGLAHDFNNLLAAILGNLDMALQDLPSGSTMHGHLTEATQASRRAVELTRQMLAYAGKGRYVTRPVPLSGVLQENAGLLRASIARTASLDLQLEPDLPDVLVDPSQVQQVVVNLVTNGSEALGDGPGVITVRTGMVTCSEDDLRQSRLDERPAPGRFVFLEVTDTGGGMDEATAQRLFDPFFSTKFAGRGLGMSAVLGIVRGHQGAITVESAPGRGTRVRVLFPVAAAGAEPVARTTRAQTGASQPEHSGTAIVADDEPAVRRMCQKMLERIGFTVVTAADGVEAVERFEQHRETTRLVLLDLTMPRMDGVAAYGALRALSPDVCVIVTSGYGEEATRDRFGAAETPVVIEKPVRLQVLRETIGRLLPER